MHNTPIAPQNQTISSDKLGIFGDYFSLLKVGGLLNKAGITKTKGASPLELFSIVFNLALGAVQKFRSLRIGLTYRTYGDFLKNLHQRFCPIIF